MAVPTPLLRLVEQHSCFTGCYAADTEMQLCLDPVGQVQKTLVVSCQDCFAHLGTLTSLVPSGSTTYGLANDLTQHVRLHRGFKLSFGGYHARGPGFWCSGVYLDCCGLFLLNGERSRPLGTDLEILLLAFKHGVLTPPDPRMDNPALYTTQEVFVNFAGWTGPLAGKAALLASKFCRSQPSTGFQRVTLAEFQPLAKAATAAGVPPTTTSAAPAPLGPNPAKAATASSKAAADPAKAVSRQAMKTGDICPICQAEIRERWLLQSSYIGCFC
jgi:hypothetical protein